MSKEWRGGLHFPTDTIFCRYNVVLDKDRLAYERSSGIKILLHTLRYNGEYLGHLGRTLVNLFERIGRRKDFFSFLFKTVFKISV